MAASAKQGWEGCQGFYVVSSPSLHYQSHTVLGKVAVQINAHFLADWGSWLWDAQMEGVRR
jgi:hypothetical protein